jgi:hypothetical protein
MGSFLVLLLLMLILLIQIETSYSSATYNLQVGAFGDGASVGSMGVRAEIRTHAYTVPSPEEDGFWVAENLENGAFIQFDYLLEHAGNYCSTGEMRAGVAFTCRVGYETVNGSEALSFWQYWPVANGSRYYYGLGRFDSVGVNGSWHLYGLGRDSQGAWGF